MRKKKDKNMAGHDQKLTLFIFYVHLTILKILFAYLKYLNNLNFEDISGRYHSKWHSKILLCLIFRSLALSS